MQRIDVCDDSGRSVELVVQVLRPSADEQGDTPLSWAYPPEAFSLVGERDYTLPPTLKVQGEVSWDGSRVPASLWFMRDTMTQGFPRLDAVPVEVQTRRNVGALEGDEATDYQTVLVEGASYDIVVTPSKLALGALGDDRPAFRVLPPLYFSDVLIREMEH